MNPLTLPRTYLLTGLGVLGIFALSVAAPPAAPAPAVDFTRDVLPVLQRACVECHGPEKQKGKLRLDDRTAALRGGSSGPVLVPGKPDDSELFRRIAIAKGETGIMPARGEPLSAGEI